MVYDKLRYYINALNTQISQVVILKFCIYAKNGTPRGGPAWLISYFTCLFCGIPGFPLLFIEVVEVAGVDGTLLVEVPGLGIIFVDDWEVLGIDV